MLQSAIGQFPILGIPTGEGPGDGSSLAAAARPYMSDAKRQGRAGARFGQATGERTRRHLGGAQCAVIFDCDGVLVDSEVLSARVARTMARSFRLTMSPRAALALIRGRKVGDWVDELRATNEAIVPATFIAEFRARCAALYATELRPVPHAEDVVRGLRLPYCIASSAPREKIELTLRLTGLLPLFAGRIFSAYEIGAWKPDPGLFLHAAAVMRVAPANCAVIEDSFVGVEAARAAGMTVFALAARDRSASLAATGATVFASMKQLPRLLGTWRTRRQALLAPPTNDLAA
jgi:HAD superfamily hydrolase (TIGR01509 family)